MYNGSSDWVRRSSLWSLGRGTQVKVSVTFRGLTINYIIEPNSEESPDPEWIRLLIDEMKEEDDGEEEEV